MTWHGGLSSTTLTTQEVPPQSSAALVNGNGVDMQGWDGVAFHVNIGAIVGAGTYQAYVNRAATSNFATPTNVALATGSVACTTPNVVDVLEVWRPSQRFVRCSVLASVAAVLMSVTAVRYRRGGLLPPVQSADQRIIVMEN